MSQDQTNEAIGSGSAEPVEKTQAVPSSNQVSGEVKASEYSVEGQNFKDLSELKSYAAKLAKEKAELHKGFTQKTQEYSSQLKAWDTLRNRLGVVQKDPAKWKQLQGLLAEQQEIQEQQTNTRPEIAIPSKMEERLRAAEDVLELQNFRLAHSDVPVEKLTELVKFIQKKDEMGLEYSLEDGWILMNHGAAVVNATKEGEEKGREAAAKGKAAGAVLGSSGTNAKPSRKSYGKMSEQEQDSHIGSLLDKLGVGFDE